ncbi:DUF6538 domain-containing protein [Xanthobacter nonsaccharivorans]|uniref:DUF6538 domain-containing protein n=1 Tax=Xanthobacter nonsaccharivorans TaxID=3119912 RepID=UPI00372D0D78
MKPLATQGGEMARDSRLFKRAGKWTFRVRVPADIQGRIGKKEIWKSLATFPTLRPAAWRVSKA